MSWPIRDVRKMTHKGVTMTFDKPVSIYEGMVKIEAKIAHQTTTPHLPPR